ncbi:hypothetical protein I203_101647 [Kwoniella mangroviensis CBS 8507]|uniref:uncharacterized protein n=1 Tax=Kwoniella mangroviensis CBS 8507 TaxID=1296122 RepID=UPI00080CCCE5|nr:uncharacterized protein I203_07214 [Kwoniella mangroviensis CBS 8507]OCF63518.1 hypothetical protein I203_07214 [Kwoniella mangroviensis CBS 8507]
MFEAWISAITTIPILAQPIRIRLMQYDAMSWKSAGQLISGPPSSSSSEPVFKRLRPNSYGSSAFQRDTAHLSHYGPNSDLVAADLKSRKSDWDVVKENHRFIRDDEEPQNVSWEERVARAYESKLFKEFALIDLKHFKSHQFALRWRTAPEVINGVGEDTCGSLRCKYHNPPSTTSSNGEERKRQISLSNLRFKDPDTASSSRLSSVRRDHEDDDDDDEIAEDIDEIPPLRSYELPFVYMEDNQRKEALVKVRLCARCERKLKWKSDDERDKSKSDEKKSKSNDKSRDRDRNRGGRDDQETQRGPRSRKKLEDSGRYDLSDSSDEDYKHPSRTKGREDDRNTKSKHRSHPKSRSRSPSRHRESSRSYEHSRHHR